MAKVAIIGAGVVGTASAYMLCKAGLDVTLIDRNPGPAQGASRANGAQLSYAYGDALASPSFLAHMPEILLKRDPAYRVRLQADPEFLIWGLRFLFNSLQSRFIANTRYLLQMAAETSDLLGDVLKEFDLSFDYQSSGKMILYSTLSGGNQQKVAIAKQLSVDPRVMVMDEPTRGIDVGAKAEIHRLLRELASRGVGIVVISSEMPELIGLCDRVLVVREGRVAGELAAGELGEEAIIMLASGVQPNSHNARAQNVA